ncbi:MAG: hypothetical protein IJB34_06490 [Clostridia bacterium]|nr:hypothetical protein [Clostridia bacterium]
MPEKVKPPAMRVDIYFILRMRAQRASFLQDSDADCALEDLTSMYGELVYGENVTFAEKMYGDFAEFNKYEGKYWSSNWNAAGDIRNKIRRAKTCFFP